MKRVYISGKIGEKVLSEATRQKFAEAEAKLRAKGYDVFNPTTSGFGKYADMMAYGGLSLYQEMDTDVIIERKHRGWYDCIMLLDIEALSWCDAICMLPDWPDSPGARVEKAYAEAIGLDFLPDLDLL